MKNPVEKSRDIFPFKRFTVWTIEINYFSLNQQLSTKNNNNQLHQDCLTSATTKTENKSKTQQ
jgi:hypothetical protein